MTITLKATAAGLLIGAGLAACSMSETETLALKEAAVQHARQTDKALQLAYLDCYALSDLDKDRCRRKLGRHIKSRADASRWEYIRPFEYEMERLGFAVFLRGKKQPCAGVNQGPQYDKQQNAYAVQCTSDQQYFMRYDREPGQWVLVK